MSNIINKVKDAVTHHGDKDHKSSTGSNANAYDSTQSSNYGPHDTNTANAVDPRVDSDRNAYGTSGVTGTTGSTGTYGTTGTTGTSTSDAYDLNRSTNHGHHDSNIANKADPRLDSDRDGRASYGTTGATGTGLSGTTGSSGFAPTTHSSTQPISTGAGSTGAYGTTGTTGATGTGLSGTTGSTGLSGTTGSSGFAPTTHSSTQPISTGAGSTGAYGTTGTTGTTGTGSTADAYDLNRSTNHGHHDSNIANKADPRLDSDRDGRASYGSTGAAGTTGAFGTTGATGTTGGYDSVPSTRSAATGPASSTAGPHSSNIANEADPRVDSDQSKQKKEHLAGEFSGVDRFDKDVHKGSIAGGNQVIGLHGSKGPTTTKNFDQSQNESAVGGSSYNTGGSTTAGPHKSDTLNKLDPRVDSDLDGSKTIGGNQTGAQTQRY